MSESKTHRILATSFLLVVFGCFNACCIHRPNPDRHDAFLKAVSLVWERDTCGYESGERNAVATLLNRYINTAHPKWRIDDIERALGTPDEVRMYSNPHWYYCIGASGKCAPIMDRSVFILDITVQKRGRKILGSAIYIGEPEDN